MAPRGVGVSEDQTAELVFDLVRRHAGRFPPVWDAGKAVAEGHRVTGLPIAVVIDRDGIGVDMRAGCRSDDTGELEPRLRELGVTVPE